MSSPSRLPLARRLTQEQASSLLERLEGYRLFVAASRGPIHHQLLEGTPQGCPAAGGLATALAGLAGYMPVTWVATATNLADRLVGEVAPRGKPMSGSPRVKYVPVAEQQFDWFYRHFANPVLWFLQHQMWDLLKPSNSLDLVEAGWIMGYRPVNAAFAEVLSQEMRGVQRPVVLSQDYHLYLLPAILRQQRPDVLLQHFTHIPWPPPERWSPLTPAVRRAIHKGLLGADIAGFQTAESVDNFLRSCEEFVPGVRVDPARRIVSSERRQTLVRSYPISVDPAALRADLSHPDTMRHREQLRPLLGERTIVRVDRVDPSKNLVRGFRAYGQLLARRPDLVGMVRFLAFLVPSRETIAEYREHAEEVWREVDRINNRFGTPTWRPIEVFHENNRLQALAGMALADVLLVNPVADGMNLVAKEGPIVSERNLVLVLSNRCGAYEQLGAGALGVEPTDVAATSRALEIAIEMPQVERIQRLSMLRSVIEAEDLSWWIRCQLTDLFDSADL